MTYEELFDIAAKQFKEGIMPLDDFEVICRIVSKKVVPKKSKKK